MKKIDLVYREIYKRVAATGKEIRLDCPNEGAALALRLAIYRAVRPVREAPEKDTELANALDSVIISIDKANPATLIIRNQPLNNALLKAVLELEIDVSKLEDPEDAIGREMGKRLLQELGPAAGRPAVEAPFGLNDDGTPKKNKYY